MKKRTGVVNSRFNGKEIRYYYLLLRTKNGIVDITQGDRFSSVFPHTGKLGVLDPAEGILRRNAIWT